ncbi:MAG: hypothetical protein HZC01_00020 [Candidatus Kerfeldbacteria bacterium]|nr:hypothetical protein [Candidatus Kerfeldbacteria bacterium]
MLYLFNRFVPYISAILIASTFAIWSIRPTWIVGVGITFLLIAFGSVWSLTHEQSGDTHFFQFITTPLALIICATCFFVFIDNDVVRWIFVGGISIIFTLLLKNIFSFLHQTEKYQPYALENIYSYSNLLALFLLYGSAFGANILIGWRFWPLFLIILFASGFLYSRTLWSYKISWKAGRFFTLIAGLTMAELAYVLSFLPVSYVVSAITVTCAYYLFMNISKDYLKDSLSASGVRAYVLIAGGIILAVFLTTKWI